MKQNIEDLLELSKKTLKRYVHIAGNNSGRLRAKADKEEDKAMSTNGEKYPHKQSKHIENARSLYKKSMKRSRGIDNALNKLSNEEVESPSIKATPERTAAKKAYDRAHADFVKNRNADTHAKMLSARAKVTKAMGEEVQPIEELSNATYKSYSKKSSRDADKHINRFLKGGNEKSITHAEKRSKGINTAQQLMARKKMTVEGVELEEKDTHNKNIAKEYLRSTDSRHSSYDGPEDAADADSMARHRASKKHGYDSDAFDHHVKKQAGKKDVIMSRINKRVSKSSDPRDVVNHNGKYIQKRDRKSQQEETEMKYNEEDGHIALVNAILDGNRDEANEIFDDVVSSRLNPVITAKKEELAASMFATEEIEEEYIPLPLTEEAEHGHHHRIHANLTDSKNTLSNDTHNAYMSGNVTKEHKKDILKHVKSAEGSLDSAKSKLGSAESADHLNTAAVHITNGNAHLQNVRTYTSLGFRSY